MLKLEKFKFWISCIGLSCLMHVPCSWFLCTNMVTSPSTLLDFVAVVEAFKFHRNNYWVI
jgi:hypothetical protein